MFICVLLADVLREWHLHYNSCSRHHRTISVCLRSANCFQTASKPWPISIIEQIDVNAVCSSMFHCVTAVTGSFECIQNTFLFIDVHFPMCGLGWTKLCSGTFSRVLEQFLPDIFPNTKGNWPSFNITLSTAVSHTGVVWCLEQTISVFHDLELALSWVFQMVNHSSSLTCHYLWLPNYTARWQTRVIHEDVCNLPKLVTRQFPIWSWNVWPLSRKSDPYHTHYTTIPP